MHPGVTVLLSGADPNKEVLKLAQKGVEMEVTNKARDWLAVNGYDAKMGARPMARLIQEKLKKPLAEELLFGKLVNGGTVLVDELDNEIIFKTSTFECKVQKQAVGDE